MHTLHVLYIHEAHAILCAVIPMRIVGVEKRWIWGLYQTKSADKGFWQGGRDQ